jgi:hypothetical protein
VRLAACKKHRELQLCGLYNSQRKGNTRNPFTADTSNLQLTRQITTPLYFPFSQSRQSAVCPSPTESHFDTENTATSTLTIRPHRHWQYGHFDTDNTNNLSSRFSTRYYRYPKLKAVVQHFTRQIVLCRIHTGRRKFYSTVTCWAVDKSSYQSQQGQRFFSSPQWEVLLWCSLGLPTRGYHLYNWINQLSNTTIWWLGIYVVYYIGINYVFRLLWPSSGWQIDNKLVSSYTLACVLWMVEGGWGWMGVRYLVCVE